MTFALAVGGCSSSSSSSPSAAPTTGASSSPSQSSGDGGTQTVPTKVTIGTVAGIGRKNKYRQRFRSSVRPLEKRVGKAVDAWFDGAYVGVSYPRSSFGDAFASFAPQAAADAWKQKTLMTNWSLRHRISGVDVTGRRVWIDVLAPGGLIAGATARVRLSFTTSGHAKKKVTVTGRLFLTRSSHGTWRIFGFDVSKGAK